MSNVSEFEKVKEFYRAFQQDRYMSTEKPSLSNLEDSRAIMKVDLIAEEFIEMVGAFYGEEASNVLERAYREAKAVDSKKRDTVEVADALVDMRYVIYGLEIEANLPSEKLFNEVHSSNMSKLDDNGNPIVSDGTDGYPKGKILKSKGYFKPDLEKIIKEG